MRLADAFNEFVLDRESNLLRPASIRFYRTHVGGFVRFVGGAVGMDAVDRGAVRRFFAHLARRVQAGEISRSTVAAYDRALRAFGSFCVAEGWIEVNPMADRRRVRVERRLPDTWTPDEVRAILGTCDTCPVGIRDRAIVGLMLDTGLRAGEVCACPMGCLVWDGEHGAVRVRAEWSKSHADRIVPVSVPAMVLVQDWITVRPERARTVFVAVRGRALTCEPLTPNGLNQMMRRRVVLAGVPMKRKLCHIWRHTFAKGYIQNGGDVETLRRILGHQSSETTRVYLGFRDAEVAAQHARYSPAIEVLSE